MKKSIILLLMVLLLGLTGCNQPAAPVEENPNGQSEEPEANLHNGVDISEHRVLNVITFGGSFEESQRANLEKSGFEEEYNCTVNFVLSDSGAETMAKIQNKEVDVVVEDMITITQGQLRNIFAEIDSTKVPNLVDVYPKLVSNDYVIIDVGAYCITYNKELIDTIPASWKDLWDEEYKGKLQMTDMNADTVSLLCYMAETNGGSMENLDPGFEAMAALAPNVHTWTTNHSQRLELFRSGDVNVGVWTDGRVAWASDNGVELEYIIPEEGAFAMTTTMAIVADCGKLDLAYAYMNMEISPESQTSLAEILLYFPANEKAYECLTEETKSKLALTPENVENIYIPDWKIIVANYDQFVEKWEKEVRAASN